MKQASKSLFIVAASAALLLAGCAKKPIRPDPSSTALGPTNGGGGNLAPTDVSTTDANSTLQTRDPLQPVYFALDRDAITQAERPKLQAAKDYLDKNPQYRLMIEGHCDWRGTSEYNLGLGDHRASEAKKYLISIGVAADKIETVSKGSEGATKEGGDAVWSKDRRDELVVLKKS